MELSLSDFEKEYAEELEKFEVSVDDLKALGISEKTLAREVFLRKIYGDKIIESNEQVQQEINGGKKMITRLGEDELNLKSELRSVYDEIDGSAFDKNLDLLGLKFDEE